MNSLAWPFAATMIDTGGDQGEIVVLPLQFVVASNHGRFHPASLASTVDGTLTVSRGMLIGEVRNGTTRRQVRSPFSGTVDTWLVWAGQLVAPGQPLCSLRTVALTDPPTADTTVGD
jgi:multidrug efflux pump subunit AcrA (membrane-fusion protein)